MKKLVFFLLVLAVSVSVSEAKPGFGFKFGLNLAGVRYDPDDGTDISRGKGLMLGGCGEVSLNAQNTIFGRGEVMYVQKGWKEEADILGFYTESTTSISEFVLAPAIAIRFPSKGLTPFVTGGLELGLNLQAKIDAEVPDLDLHVKDDIEDWSSTNVGLNLGIGGAIPSKNGETTLELRYNLGLSNMYTGDGDWSATTNGIQFIAGYMFSTASK